MWQPQHTLLVIFTKHYGEKYSPWKLNKLSSRLLISLFTLYNNCQLILIVRVWHTHKHESLTITLKSLFTDVVSTKHYFVSTCLTCLFVTHTHNNNNNNNNNNTASRRFILSDWLGRTCVWVLKCTTTHLATPGWRQPTRASHCPSQSAASNQNDSQSERHPLRIWRTHNNQPLPIQSKCLQ